MFILQQCDMDDNGDFDRAMVTNTYTSNKMVEPTIIELHGYLKIRQEWQVCTLMCW